MKKTLVAFIAASMMLGALAAAETVDGIEWTYTVSDGCASVGSGSLLNTAVPTSTSGAVVIPSMLGGCSVAGIAPYAFMDCRSLEGVAVPTNVTSIGAYAFADCSSLKRVDIPKGVKRIKSNAFRGCASLAEIALPDAVMYIKDHAFCNCRNLQGVHPQIVDVL